MRALSAVGILQDRRGSEQKEQRAYGAAPFFGAVDGSRKTVGDDLMPRSVWVDIRLQRMLRGVAKRGGSAGKSGIEIDRTVSVGRLVF